MFMRPWYQWYDGVPEVIDEPQDTLLRRLISQANEHPNQSALYYFDTRLTWQELLVRVRQVASSLEQLGVKSGDRVAIMLQNVPAFWEVQFATWWLGGMVVPINVMYRDQELRHHLNDSGAKVMVVLDSLASRVFSIREETSLSTIIAAEDTLDVLGPKPSVIPVSEPHPQSVRYDRLRLSSPISSDPVPLQVDDVAYLNYTSGTTGVAKGAMNTHRNVMVNARVYTNWAKLTDHDVNIVFAPLFHITGSISGIAASVEAAMPAVLLYRFDPELALAAIERHQGSFAVGSITTYLAMLNQPDITQRDLSTFTKAYSGGAPVSPATVERFRQATGQYIYNVYGLTESTSPATMVPWQKQAPVDPDSGALSVGIPVSGLDARIAPLNNPSSEEPYGTPGQLLLKGPQIVPGYWNRPEETAKAHEQDWFMTGDVAVMDTQGWIYIVDRLKDMIVASGYKVWPREVEDILYQHPAVKEAAVVGVPDPYRGETVKAFVSLREDQENPTGPEDLLAFVRERLAAYKVPRSIDILEDIPKTVSGKFLRRILRDQERSKLESTGDAPHS